MKNFVFICLAALGLYATVASANDQLVLVKDTRIIDGSKLTLRIQAESTGKFSAVITNVWFNHATGQQSSESIELSDQLDCSLSDAGKLLTCSCDSCGEEGTPLTLTVTESGNPAVYAAHTQTWATDPVTGELVEQFATIAKGMRLVEE